MGCVQVREDEVAVFERFGAFDKISGAGFHCLPVPCVCAMAGKMSLRQQQIQVNVETKTKDNVFVKLCVAVQFKLVDDEDRQYDAFYKLANPGAQVQSYCEDVVRAAVPQIELDNLFLQKDEIGKEIYEQLEREMLAFGYRIVAALITDLEPDLSVKHSMNDINASRRLRMAQSENAEAQKYSQVKAAEAAAEAAYLQGEGIARQRKALVEGIRGTVQEFTGEKSDVEPKDVMNLLMVTQYFDALKDIGSRPGTTITMAPSRYPTINEE